MTKQVFLEQFERRAVELSYPDGKLRKKIEELDTHHDFLKHTALKQGLADHDAESQASRELGNPIALAETEQEAIRERSWWGRHPIIGYILLPTSLLGPAFVLTILIIAGVVRLRFTDEQLQALFNGSGARGSVSIKDINSLLGGLFAIHYVVMTFLPLPFTWMARRSASGLWWVAVPCLICAFQGMFLHYTGVGRSFPIHYRWDPSWIGGLGPLLIAVAEFIRQGLKLKKLEPLPANAHVKPTGLAALSELLSKPIGGDSPRSKPVYTAHTAPAKPDWIKKALKTPTYWIMAAIFLIIIPAFLLFGAFVARQQRNNRPQANRNAAAVPAASLADQRAAVMEQLKARQATKETVNETTIDLSPYINVQLSESVDGKKDLKENNLLELQRGTRIYGGVPFDVQGRIQLMGTGLEQWERVFPVKSKEIRIERKCAKIHIFHGECCNMVSQVGNATVAKLLVHYADGTDKVIEINSHEHVLDWWGPIHTNGVINNRRYTTSPNSELAWAGTNPWIEQYQKTYSLRLYKSTFANPQPDVQIDSIEYLSTMTKAAPFMVGLTVE